MHEETAPTRRVGFGGVVFEGGVLREGAGFESARWSG